MQTLVIQTQYRENYAAHNEGYKHGVSEAHWKFKGGCTYFVQDLTDANINSIVANGIPTLTKLIESKNEMFEEYIIVTITSKHVYFSFNSSGLPRRRSRPSSPMSRKPSRGALGHSAC